MSIESTQTARWAAVDHQRLVQRLVRRLMQWLIWGPVKWHDPTVPTPDRQRLYATDGKDVWEIWGNGEPISPGAIRVKKWAIRREPMPFPPNTAIPNNQPHKTNE